MEVKIKRIDKTLPLPQYETEGAVAFDLIAREETVIASGKVGRVPSNIVMEVPKGYMLYLKDRSSTAKKKGLLITAGIVDQDYCGDNDEVLVQFYNPSFKNIIIERGEKLAQGIFVAINIVQWNEVESMGNKDRGGFGTTDNQIGDIASKHIDSARPKREDSQIFSEKKSGKLIALDGTDGSGKATQTDILLDRLKKEGFSASKIDFPQYGTKSAGFVENFLNGRYGDPDSLNPYIASFFYALDRYDASMDFKQLLEKGEIVVSNRYTSSNMGHQGCKFSSEESRRKYFEWLDTYEHDVFKIPRPDLTIILHVSIEYAQELLKQKDRRDYISKGDKDMLEKNIAHQMRAEQTYIEMCDIFPNYELIECVKDGRLLSKEEVSELVWEKVSQVI